MQSKALDDTSLIVSKFSLTTVSPLQQQLCNGWDIEATGTAVIKI